MSDIETTENNKNNFLPGQGSNSRRQPSVSGHRQQHPPGGKRRAVSWHAFSGCGAEQLYLSDGWFGQSVWNRRAVMYFHPAQLAGFYKEKQDSCESRISPYGISLHFPALWEAGNREAFVEFKLRYCSGSI